MKRVMTAAVLTFISVGPIVATETHRASQDPKPADSKPAAALPTVDQIMEKSIEALGGKSALEKSNTRVSKGTMELTTFGVTGSIETIEKAPNKVALVADFSAAVYKMGFDGAKGWINDPQSGLREMTPREVLETKLDHDFFLPLRLKQVYTKLEVKDKVKVGERDAYVVEATAEGHKPDKLYYDAQTYLLIRKDAEREGPQGPSESKLYIEDYRDVDGVKVPFTVRNTNPEFTFTIKLSEVKHNVPADEAKFAKPTAQ